MLVGDNMNKETIRNLNKVKPPHLHTGHLVPWTAAAAAATVVVVVVMATR